MLNQNNYLCSSFSLSPNSQSCGFPLQNISPVHFSLHSSYDQTLHHPSPESLVQPLAGPLMSVLPLRLQYLLDVAARMLSLRHKSDTNQV